VRRIRNDVRLLDLACGNIKSGNSWITLQKGFNDDAKKQGHKKRTIKVVGVDNCKDNATNIATCYIYMSNINAGPSGGPLFRSGNYDFYQENILHPLHQSDDIKLREQALTPESFNVVTCIFAIYYTFGSEKTFRSFLANVSRNLKTGGLFICSYMNGNSVRALITESGGVMAKGGNIWQIALEADVDADHSPFGHKVKVSFDGLYNGNVEYLVDLNNQDVLKLMLQYGLKVSNTDTFVTNNKLKLSDHEKTWVSLHNNICFEKVKVDDSLDVYDRMIQDTIDFKADINAKPSRSKKFGVREQNKKPGNPTTAATTVPKIRAINRPPTDTNPVQKIKAKIKPRLNPLTTDVTTTGPRLKIKTKTKTTKTKTTKPKTKPKARQQKEED
jgi:hypothetical protein